MNYLERYNTVIDKTKLVDVAIYDALYAIKNNLAFRLGTLFSSINRELKAEMLIFEIISNNDMTKIPLLKSYLDLTILKNVALLEALDEVVNTPIEIGSQYQGGTVFYLDNTGRHGLVVANEDASVPVNWGAGFSVAGSENSELGKGLSNTLAIMADSNIINTFPNGNYAAARARAYNGGGALDWYLPSKDELNLVYALKAAGKGTWDDDTLGSNYWSSTGSGSTAWVQLFYDYLSFSAGAQGVNNQFKVSNVTNRTRAIRAF